MKGNELQERVEHAIALIQEHPQVRSVNELEIAEGSDLISVEVNYSVNLPNVYKPVGVSPLGIKSLESVRFDFSSGFPIEPPQISLRADFTRNLPHVQPWFIDGRPVPCIYEGDLGELLHKAGLAAILNQTALWLDRAASGTLIDPNQGWEPVLRDSFSDIVIAETDVLRSLVDDRGGFHFAKTQFLKFNSDDNHTARVYCRPSNGPTQLNKDLIRSIFELHSLGSGRLKWGKSLALVVWAGKDHAGDEIIAETYRPETVKNVRELKERASFYGCKQELSSAFQWLKTCMSELELDWEPPLSVILVAKRPIELINSTSSLELCPYVVDIVSPTLFKVGSNTPVRPASHRYSITPKLLSQMTGETLPNRLEWTVIGAGSLGSKLSLHLGRAGAGPSVVVDRSNMSPHNAARHALYPDSGDRQILWTDAKASMLTEVLKGLGQTAKSMHKDAAQALLSQSASNKIWTKETQAVVNTTASLKLREVLGNTDVLPIRVIEVSLFAEGCIGLITTEGPERNPNTLDLISEFYVSMVEDPSLSGLVFGNDGSVDRSRTGQGCGSMTMTMSDGRLSMFAAGASEYLLNQIRNGLSPNVGEVLISRLGEDNISVNWQTLPVEAVEVIPAINASDWSVRVHPRAMAKMKDEVLHWPNSETGGVLMGRISEVNRSINVVDILQAPEDSIRSSSEFVLGTQGLRRKIESYSSSVDWSLYCLGTWHSHLNEGGPSLRDFDTAMAVALARLTPTVFLVLTPTQLHALVLDE